MFGLQFVNEIENVQREMDQLLRGLGMSPMIGGQVRRVGFKVIDSGEAFVVEAPLPGIDVEKLAINVLGRKLTLTGEFAKPDLPEQAHWYLRERRVGGFEQSLQLPADLDTEKVEAEYKNGILTINLPKSAAALPKKIAINVA